MTMHRGQCLCGSIRLEVTADPISARACWCRLCQYLAAGNATVNIVFPSEAVTITGDMAIYESVADSGNAMQRGFCPKCGTQITSCAEVRPHLTIIRAGVFDEPELGKPGAVVWTEMAPDWVKLDPDIPHCEGQPAAPPPPAD